MLTNDGKAISFAVIISYPKESGKSDFSLIKKNTEMEQIKIEEKTTIRKTSHGWMAQIFVNINGYDYNVTTIKNSRGKIVCRAQAIERIDEQSFVFSPFHDKSIELVVVEKQATEKNIKQIHFEGLMKLDQMDLPKKEQEYKIEPGQVFFLNGYGQDPYYHEDLIIYKVEDKTVYYVNETRLTLGQENLRNIRPVEKLFGIGHYYKAGDVRKDMDAVNNLVISAALENQRRKDREPIEEAERQAEITAYRAKLIEENPHLEAFDTKYIRTSDAAKNVRKQLKKYYPGISFSVVTEENSINVRWNDGPAEKEVNQLLSLFEDHQTDESGDFRDYSPTIFTKTFGGAKYIFCHRTSSTPVSDKILAFAEIVVQSEQQDLFRSQPESFIQQEEGMPENMTETTTGETSEPETFEASVISFTENDLAENDKSENNLTENDTPKTESKPAKPVKKPKPYIISHTDRSIALFNAPEGFEKLFETLYGVFKKWVKHEGNTGAWVFSKKRLNQIQSIINTL